MISAEAAKIVFLEQMLDLFKTECYDRALEIDPNNILDWFSLTIGWAISKGLSTIDANDFAIHVRYETDLG